MHKCHQSLENILGKSVPSGSPEQDRHPFSVKGQVVNVLGFAGRTVSCIFFCFIFYFFPQPLRNVMLILSSQAVWKQAAGGFDGGPARPPSRQGPWGPWGPCSPASRGRAWPERNGPGLCFPGQLSSHLLPAQRWQGI